MSVPGSPRALVARVRPLARELGKFVVVGGLCFALDAVLANIFHFSLGFGPTTAKALSSIIATVVSYAGNRLWSFSHRVDSDNPTHGRDILLFGVINGVGLVITLVPVDIVHYTFGLTSSLAFNASSVGGTALATVFRFWAYRRWVFTAPQEVAETAGEATAGIALATRSGDGELEQAV